MIDIDFDDLPELDYKKPGDYEEPRYHEGFAPGSWARVRDCEGQFSATMWQECDEHVLESGYPGRRMGGACVDLITGERVFVIARPGFGNPWPGGCLGVCLCVVPRLCRIGYIWAARLVEETT